MEIIVDFNTRLIWFALGALYGFMEVHEEVCRAIDSYRETAVSLSHEIHQHPELKFEEYFACDLLTRHQGIGSDRPSWSRRHAFGVSVWIG